MRKMVSMITVLFAVSFLITAAPAQAQCNIGCDANGVGNAVGQVLIGVGGIYQTKKSADVAIDEHRTAEKINDRNAKAAENQSADQKEVALAEINGRSASDRGWQGVELDRNRRQESVALADISLRREESRNRAAVDALATGRNGTAIARDGTVRVYADDSTGSSHDGPMFKN